MNENAPEPRRGEKRRSQRLSHGVVGVTPLTTDA